MTNASYKLYKHANLWLMCQNRVFSQVIFYNVCKVCGNFTNRRLDPRQRVFRGLDHLINDQTFDLLKARSRAFRSTLHVRTLKLVLNKSLFSFTFYYTPEQ